MDCYARLQPSAIHGQLRLSRERSRASHSQSARRGARHPVRGEEGGEGEAASVSVPVSAVGRSSSPRPTAASALRSAVSADPGCHPKGGELDKIEDEEFRAVLDPGSGLDALEAAWQWDEQRQDQFVALLQPAHLSLLMNKRLQAGLLHRAKTLSFTGLTIVQRGVEVLTEANGELRAGEMVGLIGGPDSGVSPLLTALSQQIERKRVTAGKVRYDGRPPGPGYTQAVGYAVKQDTHIAALTVYESLYFSARTRLPNHLPNAAVRLRVKVVMKLLGLSHVADTVVGDAMTRGISGGEKRRLGFGLEMVAGHSVVLADLPTNGLDSATALGLLQTMSYACKMGVAVMLSLVRPASSCSPCWTASCCCARDA